MTMKIVCSSDHHMDAMMVGKFDETAGIHSNWVESLRQLRNVVDLCNEVDADVWVNSGDMFHTGKPLPHIIALVDREMKRLRKTASGKYKTKVVMANGNHDQTGIIAGHSTPLDAYLQFELDWCTHVAAVPEIVDIDGLRLAAVPWHRVAGATQFDETEAALVRNIRGLADECARGNDPSLLFGHLMLEDISFTPSKRGSERTMAASILEAGVSAAFLDEGPWVASRLGHVHKRQQVSDKTGYIGSTYKVDFGEAGESKGAEVLTIEENGEMTLEFVPFDTRQLVALDLSEGITPLSAAMDSFNSGDILRVLMAHDQDGLSPRGRAMLTKLTKKGVSVETRRKPRQIEVARKVSLSPDSDPKDAMSKYIDAKVQDGTKKERLMNTFSDVMGRMS